jgi:uncharacterized protein (DUF433 family)
MTDWEHLPAVERIPEIMSGAWVFRGTCVPVAALFDNLRDGATVDDFLAWFPGVTREQVAAVLEHADEAVVRASGVVYNPPRLFVTLISHATYDQL